MVVSLVFNKILPVKKKVSVYSDTIPGLCYNSLYSNCFIKSIQWLLSPATFILFDVSYSLFKSPAIFDIDSVKSMQTSSKSLLIV